jgi:hypothetical protein
MRAFRCRDHLRKALGATRAHQSARGAVVRAIPAATGDRCDMFASELVNGNRCLGVFFTKTISPSCRHHSCTPGWNRRRSATVPRALTCVPDARLAQRISPSRADARPRSAHLTQDRHTHDTRPHVSACARRGVAMPLGGAQLRSRHDTPRRAPVPAPAALSPRFRGRPEASRHSSVPLSPAPSCLLSGRRVSPLPPVIEM